MEDIFLDVELREEIGRGRVKDLRDQGFLPAVVYKEGKESHAIKVPRKQLLHLLHEHGLENVVINLNVKSAGKNSSEKNAKARPCLIKEIQYHPVVGDIIHVDFNEISLTKVIKVNVPIVAKGEPIGVKQEGGSLEHILWEIEVECLPTDIPKEIEVDVTAMKMGDSIHIRDINLPPNIKVLNDLGAVLLSVAAPMKEEVPVAPIEGAEVQEPEVIKEKKEVSAEGEAPEAKEKEKEKK